MISLFWDLFKTSHSRPSELLVCRWIEGSQWAAGPSTLKTRKMACPSFFPFSSPPLPSILPSLSFLLPLFLIYLRNSITVPLSKSACGSTLDDLWTSVQKTWTLAHLVYSLIWFTSWDGQITLPQSLMVKNMDSGQPVWILTACSTTNYQCDFIDFLKLSVPQFIHM